MKHATNYKIVVFLEHLASRAFGERPKSFFAFLVVNSRIVGKSGDIGSYGMIAQCGKADFGKILKFVQTNPRKCKIKDQVGKPMIAIENVASVDVAIELLNQMVGRLSRSDKEMASK